MELYLSASTTASVSHTLNLGFALGGTLTSIGYLATVSTGATSAATANAASSVWVNTATSTPISAAASATNYRNILVKGLVRSTSSGTFIPQLSYSVSPGGTGAVYPNAYMKLVPLASDTTLNSTAWL